MSSSDSVNCWCRVKGVPAYQCINYIHPLKQKAVGELIEYTKEKYPNVKLICVFGSSVTPRCHPGSDIDIVIDGDDVEHFVPPENDEYDVLRKSWIDPKSELAREIEREGVVVYG